jgi:hypothetical protein
LGRDQAWSLFFSIAACCGLGFSLVACGGISNSLDTSLDGGDSGDGGVVDLGDLGDRDGAVKQDGSAIDASAGVIDPIAMGEAWTYDVTVAGEFSECNDGSFASNVSQTESLDGKNAFLISSFCPGIQSVWYAADGDTVYAYDGQAWLLALGAPVVDGHTWTNTLETFVWKNVGQVTVPAGTFLKCFEADVQDEAHYYAVTFCRGAGPVKWHYRDASGSNGYDAVLQSKNF